jgi:hypothetical protein
LVEGHRDGFVELREEVAVAVEGDVADELCAAPKRRAPFASALTA